jgi:hypothetical protein
MAPRLFSLGYSYTVTLLLSCGQRNRNPPAPRLMSSIAAWGPCSNGSLRRQAAVGRAWLYQRPHHPQCQPGGKWASLRTHVAPRDSPWLPRIPEGSWSNGQVPCVLQLLPKGITTSRGKVRPSVPPLHLSGGPSCPSMTGGVQGAEAIRGSPCPQRLWHLLQVAGKAFMHTLLLHCISSIMALPGSKAASSSSQAAPNTHHITPNSA